MYLENPEIREKSNKPIHLAVMTTKGKRIRRHVNFLCPRSPRITASALLPPSKSHADSFHWLTQNQWWWYLVDNRQSNTYLISYKLCFIIFIVSLKFNTCVIALKQSSKISYFYYSDFIIFHLPRKGKSNLTQVKSCWLFQEGLCITEVERNMSVLSNPELLSFNKAWFFFNSLCNRSAILIRIIIFYIIILSFPNDLKYRGILFHLA